MDSGDCSKRYLCELAATPFEELTQKEMATFAIFPVGIESSFVFDSAVRLGAATKNLKACRNRYNHCVLEGATVSDVIGTKANNINHTISK
jgi:hypothetical protein